MIYVTRPVLPSFLEYVWQLRKIWRSNILTNNGPIAEDLRKSLEKYLDVQGLTLVCNGTCALDVALEAMSLEKGSEVITTPFSFVATANAIVRKGLKPVFVDVECDGYNICPQKIAEAITPRTSAILGVHVYGIPVRLKEIEDLARSHKLALIYDAAHSFGVKFRERSLLAYGDISTCSFHATKVFNTGEGGCTIMNYECPKNINRGINFGFCSENDISEFGINAKMSEFAAALGVANLKSVNNVIRKRARVFKWYSNYLNEGLIPEAVSSAHNSQEVMWNYAYMPIRMCGENGEEVRDSIYEALRRQGIFSRKYFYPLITQTTAYMQSTEVWSAKGALRNAIEISKQTLCLPIYPGISERSVKRIASIVNNQMLGLMQDDSPGYS